jgi:predicted membrane metal-binding protein
MLTVAAIGLWLGRPGSASVVWLWALAVVLVWDPWATLTPGFWLSFGAVGLLLYIGVGRIGGASKWREALRAQGAITLGLIPLMLVLFQQISIVSPLANAVAIPVVTFIVVPLTLASIVVPWDVLLIIAHQTFAWVALLLEWLSAMPAAVWQQHAPAIFAAVAGMLGVVWLLAAESRVALLDCSGWHRCSSSFRCCRRWGPSGSPCSMSVRGSRCWCRRTPTRSCTTPVPVSARLPTPAIALSRRYCAPTASHGSTAWS